MNVGRKLCITLILACVCVFCLTVSAYGAEDDSRISVGDEEWSGFVDGIPDGAQDMLPDGALDGSDSFAESISEMSTGEYAISAVTDILGEELAEAAKLFALIIAAIVLSAVFGAIGEGSDSTALSSAMRFCSVGAVASAMMLTLNTHFDRIEEFFEQIRTAVSGMIPVTASIWAMGGNVSTAAVGNATFYVMLNVSEGIYASTVIPVCCVMTVLGVCESLSDDVKTARIMNAIKKTYYFILGVVMTLLLSSLAAQTALAASADTAAARTARMVSGTVIPILGGSVGETLRILASGVAYLKNAFGIGGIIIILLMVLPLVISVLLTRLALMLGAGIADMLGCGGQARLLEDLCEVYGCMLAVISAVAVMFILSLCIFMQTVVAVM